MNKEPAKDKSIIEKVKESIFGTVLMAAGIVLAVILLLWIPFKVLPFIFGNGTSFVSTTLSSLIVSEDSTSTTNDTITKTDKSTKTDSSVSSAKNNSVPSTKKVYSGLPDLQISFIGTGIIDLATGQYVPTSYAGYNDEIAIKFEVKNIGTNVTGAWKLRINSPSRTTPIYDSSEQVSIKPGDKMVFTASFNSPINTGVNTAYITADPLNQVVENSDSNNQIVVPIKIEGTTYKYGNNYNYGNNVSTNLPYGTLFSWVNINANCYANPQTSYLGSPITWYATATGGNGYFEYSWTGTDSLHSNQSTATQSYYSSGTKYASVTVTSNGVSVTKQCSVLIY